MVLLPPNPFKKVLVKKKQSAVAANVIFFAA